MFVGETSVYLKNEVKNEDEIAIMKEYGSGSKRFTLIISCKIFTDIYCDFTKWSKFWQNKINNQLIKSLNTFFNVIFVIMIMYVSELISLISFTEH